MVGRTRKIRGIQALVLGCAAGLALGGCSDTDDGDSSDQTLADYLGYSPLDDLSGGFQIMSAGSDAQMSDEEKNKQRQVEDLVAKCMRDEGFEYVPRSPDEAASTEFDEAFSLEPAEFVRRYGYGIATLGGGEDDDGAADPNDKIRQQLSPTARKAYNRALYGPVPETDGAEGAEGGPVTRSVEIGGCLGEATDQVHGSADAERMRREMDEFQDLFEDLDQLRERLVNEPRLRAAIAEWSDCMAGRGHPDLSEPGDAQDRVLERMFPSDDDAGANSTGDGGLAAPIGPDTPDPEELEKLRDYELDIAGADFDCQQEHVEDVRAEVAPALEQRFVSEHRDELERYRDTIGANGGPGRVVVRGHG